MKKSGKQGNYRGDNKLYPFEKTTELVDRGIYKYIRHLLYSSLLFLTWGIYLKNPNAILFLIAFMSSAFLFIAALFDEKGCIEFFGENYRDYMKRSKRFVPFIW